MSNKVPLSVMPDYYTASLQDFLSDLGETVATINLVELLTAINAKTESEKFKKLALQGRYVGGFLLFFGFMVQGGLHDIS